jgi:hypothetical protein
MSENKRAQSGEMSESKKDLKQVRKRVEEIRLLLAGHWLTKEKSALGEMARLTLELCDALLDMIDALEAPQ